MRLRPNIRYGTERFPEKVARRLRAFNLIAWISATAAAGFAVVQFLDLTPGLWKVAVVNAVAAPTWAAMPLLHRFGPLAAPLCCFALIYVYFIVVIWLAGTGNGMQMYFLVGTALALVFFGIERIVLAVVCAGAAAACMIALQFLVPHSTGLQAESALFGSYVVTTLVSCLSLIWILYNTMRDTARAEATAEHEYQRSESLLVNILPASIAARLKSRTGGIIADRYEEASVLFADMAGFTERASDTAPDDLVRFLDRAFTGFDRLVERHDVEKIKTTGDAYMVVSGVPTPRPDHAEALATLALEMRDVAAHLRDPRGRGVPIRIGIASGPVVAGVVGTHKFFYDVWGDAVNVASRMESTGVAGRIQVSPEAHQRLMDKFVLEARGPVEVKGKGSMPTWFLVSRQDTSALQHEQEPR